MTLIKAKKLLKQYFGYDEFWPLQGEIVERILSGKDAVVLMPTGGGKSICYQIPALCLPGLTVVVSPLISLMQDQVVGLKANGVKAEFLNSSLGVKDQKIVEEKVLSGEVKLLYVSPERLIGDWFMEFLDQVEVSLFAVDEAHCISAWGHDFRPEYAKLKVLRERFMGVPIVALTATADKVTRRDIVDKLGLSEPEVFVASFDRPNLSLTVLPGRNRMEHILQFVRERKGQSGIVYCLSRKSTEKVATALGNAGIKADYYHANLSSERRRKVQEDFINDRTEIICATIAFGMGIDKSNVRWVIHFNLPKNIEGYYQEIGRAGRDGMPSDTVLFYSYGDVMTLRNFVEGNKVQIEKLNRMMQYADALICRRKILLSYFGEELKENCGNCDVCSDPPEYFDGTVIAQKALSAVARVRQSEAVGMVIDVLRGSGKREVLMNRYQDLSVYGVGKEINYQDWQQYLMQLVQQGYIEIAYDEGSSLKLTRIGVEVLKGIQKVQLLELSVIEKKIEERIKKSKMKPKRERVKDDLFEVLRELRSKIAKEDAIAPYLVFHDKTLAEMAARRPVSEVSMKDISGVGERKFEKYGEKFMEKINRFVREGNGATHRVARTFVKGDTKIVSYDFFRQGLRVHEIAVRRNLKPSTIFGHLADLYLGGKDVDIYKLAPKREIDEVVRAVKQVGVESMKDIYEFLDEEVDYNVIRLGVAKFLKDK